MESSKLKDFVLQITSDAVCGRREQAFEAIELVCQQKESDDQFFSNFLELYEKENHHFSAVLSGAGW